jgi:hypothetical protein
MARPAAQQHHIAVRQEVAVHTRVERADAFIDVHVSEHAWPSGTGASVDVRLDVRHAAELHRKLGSAIVSARKWEERQRAAIRRNAKKRKSDR